MKTPFGIRASIRLSKVPQTAWAEALGVRYSSIQRLVRGDSSMQTGPLMRRAMKLVEALDAGTCRWVPSRTRTGYLHWRIEGGDFGPTSVIPYRVDFLHGKLSREVSA